MPLGLRCAVSTAFSGGEAPAAPLAGLDWPANTGNSGDTVRLDWLGADMPNAAPLTIIRKFFPHGPQPEGYNAQQFFCDVQPGFSSDQKYWGTHQYPKNFGAGPEPRNWEVSIEGIDKITCDNANSTEVQNNQWVTQATRVTDAGSDEILVEFFYDIGAGFDRVISYTTNSNWLAKSPSNPGFVWGDAPWNPGNELMNGIIRGWQWYEAALTTTQMGLLVAEDYDEDVLTVAAGQSLSPWFLNMNPTVADHSDKSGNGNHATGWVNSNRPADWSS